MKSAILLISFGTSIKETRAKTIDAIEKTVREAFPETPVYPAWSSNFILKKLRRLGEEAPDSIEEALDRMAADGITEILVQPAIMIPGEENDKIKSTVNKKADQFETIRFGEPLLSGEADRERALSIMGKSFPGETLVLMGHGTPHVANSIYEDLNQRLNQTGNFMGTVEGAPTLEDTVEAVKAAGIKQVTLAPFMIVAGDHALNDMAGDEDDSWKNTFAATGIEAKCMLKGLGEYEEIREMFVEHIKAMR